MKAGDLDLKGQCALVTGGGGGIGRAIALNLADMGANVAFVESIPERCEETAQRIAERGSEALPICANVMEIEKVREAVAQTRDRFGRLDILVNNAGGVAKRDFLDLKEKNFRRHIELNLVSLIVATQEAVPIMIAGGKGGSIINVTSIEGSRAAPGYAVYAACKAGVNNLTRTLAVELGEHGIRVNSIAPDLTVTPGIRGNVTGPVDESSWFKPSDAYKDAIRRRIPLCREGVADECGQLAVFLASPLSSYITGAIIPIDGGTWASSGWIRDSGNGWILPPESRP